MYLGLGISTLDQVTLASTLPVVAVGRPNMRMKAVLRVFPAVVIFEDLEWEHLNFLEINELDVFDLTTHQRYQGLHKIDQYVYNEFEFETVQKARLQETLINLLELAAMAN